MFVFLLARCWLHRCWRLVLFRIGLHMLLVVVSIFWGLQQLCCRAAVLTVAYGWAVLRYGSCRLQVSCSSGVVSGADSRDFYVFWCLLDAACPPNTVCTALLVRGSDAVLVLPFFQMLWSWVAVIPWG